MTLVSVPNGGDMLDVLAARYTAAFNKIDGGRAQWIEGTLELGGVLLEAKTKFGFNDLAFGQWIDRNGLRKLNKDARRTLMIFAKDPATARKLLEGSHRNSWEMIWREYQGRLPIERPERERRNATLPSPRRGQTPQPAGRRVRIPDVMREDGEEVAIVPRQPPAVPAERPAVILKGLTREQVDPDFVGTPLDFIAKYGQVNLHTKTEIEEAKRQAELSAFLGAMAEHERSARALLAALATLDPTTLAQWKGKPGKADRFKAWAAQIAQAAAALASLEEPRQ